jgi:hypothetical protein
MHVARRSILTGRDHVRDIPITPEQLEELNTPRRRRLIQDIVPDLSPEDREFLLSGITPEEWAEEFHQQEEA